VAGPTSPSPIRLAQLIMVTDSLKPSVLISFGSPYLLNQTPTAKSYLLAWSGVRASERAAARALLGLSPITGHLPIPHPSRVPGGVRDRGARFQSADARERAVTR